MSRPEFETSGRERKIPLSLNMAEEAKKLGMPFDWEPPKIDGIWGKKSFVSVNQLTPQDVTTIINSAREIEVVIGGGQPIGEDQLMKWLYGQCLVTLFYEPSTRTRMSFEVASQFLGMKLVSNPDMVQYSSVYKGETVADTAKTVTALYLPRIIVQRHSEVGAASIAAFATESMGMVNNRKPPQIINAGDGVGEHPTQALLDIVTIVREKGLNNHKGLKDLQIGMVGDLENGRTVHSLAKLLTILGGPARFVFISPQRLAMPQSISEWLRQQEQIVTETENLEESLPELDVLYVTRIQRERFSDPSDYERYRGSYVITPEILGRAKQDLTLMHPLPRLDEIDWRVDQDQRAAYFRQVTYGVFTRMALLCLMTGNPYPNQSVRRAGTRRLETQTFER